jgi:hypothetical protein
MLKELPAEEEVFFVRVMMDARVQVTCRHNLADRSTTKESTPL